MARLSEHGPMAPWTPMVETTPELGNGSAASASPQPRARGAVQAWRTVWPAGLLKQALPRQQHQLPLIVLLLGLLLTGVIAEHTRRLGKQTHERIEKGLLDDVADAIEVKLREDIDIISGVAGLFNASKSVSREEFRQYNDTLRREEGSLAGIQGIGFSRFVPADRWQELTAEVRAEGFPDFSIRPPGPRPLASSILFLEPFDLRNQRAFGFDMYSEPVRREAMDRAAQTGLPSLSGRVRLVQERNTGVQAGVLLYVPVYRQGIQTPPRSPADYAESLLGWAYSPIRVGDLVTTALRTVNNPDLLDSVVVVHDGGSPSLTSRIFTNASGDREPTLSHPQYQPIELGGHRWLVGIQLSRQLVGPNGFSSQVGLVLMLGSMASVIASLLTAIQVKNHLTTRRALAVAEKANAERALAATVFESCPQGIVVTDASGHVLSANQGFARLTGYSGAEILGRNLNLLKSGRHDASFYARLWSEVRERGFWQGEIWNRLRNGEIRRHELSITAVRDADLTIIRFVGMLQDITERHQAHELIRHQALHDSLTGLPSRTMLLERINLALAVAEQEHGQVGLLFIDLNGFKQVNDQHGHACGDQVLQLVARRLRGAIQNQDVVARLGGDEFVVLVPRAGSADELHRLALKVLGLIRGCSDGFEPPIAISASIGIARSPEHGITAGQLLSGADAAMYQAKQSGDGVIAMARGGIEPGPETPAETGSPTAPRGGAQAETEQDPAPEQRTTAEQWAATDHGTAGPLHPEPTDAEPAAGALAS